jgi:Copper amine oxidase N-terminal domain.
MKKPQTAKGFLLGVICTLIVSLAIVPAIAYNGTQEAILHFRDIKITLNSTAIIPKDTDGNVVEPFIIEGTTYLPVRAVSSALGLDVKWDESTSTVILTAPQDSLSVYITRTGSKYHYNSTCNGGTYWSAPFSTAIGMGLNPCEKCVN